MPVATPFTLTWTGTTLDTTVVAFSLDQSEGDFAILSIQIKNPRTGLLAGNLWATLAYNGAPIFYGRLVGIPSGIEDELVTLTFLAKPDNYDERREAVAAPLRVLPWYDPAFLPPDRRLDPDAILEARPQLWHTDRVTHEVTLSSIHFGDAGTVAIPVAFYDSVSVEMGEPPADVVSCTATITWTQKGQGQIDLTPTLTAAFDAAGSYANGMFVSITATGLLSDWPKTGSNIGGGWNVGDSSAERGGELGLFTVQCRTGGFAQAANQGVPAWGGSPLSAQWVDVEYGGGLNDGEPSVFDPTPIGYSAYDDGDGWYYDNRDTFTIENPSLHPLSWSPLVPSQIKQDRDYRGGPSMVGFPVGGIVATMKAAYDVERGREEVVTFTLRSQIQAVTTAFVEPMAFDLSAQVDQAIEETGQIPIGDVRRKSYILTTRGIGSLEHMLLQARARLLASARAVRVSFETTFETGLTLTLRHAATLTDPRLPGGSATGKIIGLHLSLDGGTGRPVAAVTIACMVGTGAAVSWGGGQGGSGGSPLPPENVLPYADPAEPDVYSVDFIGTGQEKALTSDLSYIMPDDSGVDDDGIDLSAVSAADAVISCTVVNGVGAQQALLTSQSWEDSNAAIAAVNEIPTKVQLQLKPLTKAGGFRSTFAITVSNLAVPKTIDLSAGSSP